jgi:uncharacterized protein YndB with AHSA1/START domain
MGHSIEMEVDFDEPADRVWAAFTDSELRSKWEASNYEIDPRPGGKYQWVLPGHESEGTVVECEPQQLLEQSEKTGPHSETRQTFRFASTADGGTHVELLHDGLPNDVMVKSVSLGWAQAISDLHVLLKHSVAANRFEKPLQHMGMFPDFRR